MTAFLFLQRFEKGVPAPMPLQPLMQILSRYGTAGRGQADIELSMEPDSIAFGCTVIGNADMGVSCIGFERPHYDAALRELAWECLTQLGCTIFNDTLDLVCTAPGQSTALPADLLAAATCGVRAISSAQQLWPDQLESALPGKPRPTLFYTNPNTHGPNMQLFDHGDLGRKELSIEAGIRPAACNPGTLRVLRNLELRVNSAIENNPEYKLFYRYAHSAASLLVLQSPRLAERTMRATIVTAVPGEAEPDQPDFIADSDDFVNAMNERTALAGHVLEKYQLTLDGKAASVDALAGLLDKLHAFYCRERSNNPGAAPSALATSWAIKAGSYLGEVIRTHIGGQWGFIERGEQRLRVMRTHRGRLCFPHLQVLDHVINGQADNIATWFHALAHSDASATAREQDFACSVPQRISMLFVAGALPYAAALPGAAFDFSVASLRHLDRYLDQVAQNRASVSTSDLASVMLATGAYLGEVVRRNTPDRACWQWVNYDDFVAANPEFGQLRPRKPGYTAFLDSKAQTSYPLQHVYALINGEGDLSTVHFAQTLLGAATAPDTARPLPGVLNNWPADAGMARELEHVRETLDSWRRFAGRSDYDAIRPPAVDWMQHDALGEILVQRDLLLAKGRVVWGALVQANSELFRQGADDRPADLAYSRDPYFDARPQALRTLSEALFAHKGIDGPDYLRRIADFLGDELERAYDIPVPGEMCERKVMLSTFVVLRQDLPDKILRGAWFPVLVHPDTPARMIVPRSFWSPELVALWQNGKLNV